MLWMVQKKGNTDIIQIIEIKHNENSNNTFDETEKVQTHSLFQRRTNTLTGTWKVV